MAGDGLSQVKAALTNGQGNEEGLALVRAWMRGVEAASASLVAVGTQVASAEDEFLERPAKQAHAWMVQLAERLDFLARKLSAGQ
jgi:hypothetical protein